MAIVWLPKATVQAVLSGLFLKEAKRLHNEEYMEYGGIIQTTAIFSIVIAAPLGSILISSLGPRLLTKDEIDPKDEQNKKEKIEEAMDGMITPMKTTPRSSVTPIDRPSQGNVPATEGEAMKNDASSNTLADISEEPVPARADRTQTQTSL